MVNVKIPNTVLSRMRSAPSTVSTVMKSAITRGRLRQAGCSVYIQPIHAADAALKMSPASRACGPGSSNEKVSRTQKASMP